MAEKENQRVVVTKRMLKEGLMRLMKKKDIRSISVSELCKEAGINRVTFYNHYSAPNDVLVEMGDELIAGLQTQLQKQGQKNYKERMETACNYLLENKEIAVLLFENNNPESEFAAKLFSRQKEWKIIVKKIGTLYDDDGKNLLKTFMMHGVYCIISKWLIDGINKTPKEIADLIGEISIKGMYLECFNDDL